MNSYLGQGVYLKDGIRLETTNEFKIRPISGTNNSTEILLKDCNIQINRENLKRILKNFDIDELEELLKEIKC